MSTIDEILLHTETTDEFIRKFMASLILMTKTSNDIPTGTEFSYNMTFEDFASLSERSSQAVVDVIKEIFKFIRPGESFSTPDDLLDPSLYEHLVDMIDSLLENADLLLDEASGARNSTSDPIRLSLTVDKDRLLRSNVRDIPKPQTVFQTDIDNSRERPFKPRLKTKPFDRKRLDLTELPVTSTESDVIGPNVYYAHPYESELQQLNYPEWQLADPTIRQAWVTSINQPLDYVSNEDDLQRVLDELVGMQEIAVDLENHSYRSFQGFTCLMQLSSRHKDYVIDTIALRNHMHIMRGLFANPSIVKVLHGCESDVLWLQRDFGLYIVNCFDTYHAAKILKYPALSLSHLVKIHCSISLNKKHQLSDWRVRPLPDDMLQYAKDDTHYLLQVFDCMRADLWKCQGRDGLQACLNASRKTCLKRYEKEPFWPLGYRKLLDGARGVAPKASALSEIQDAAMAALWNWRDRVAREQDESVDYIMAHSELLRLGMRLPSSEAELEDCEPLSESVRARSSELLAIISAQTDFGPAAMEAAPVSPVARKKGMGGSVGGGILDRPGGRALKTPSREMAGELDMLPGMQTNFTFTPAVSEMIAPHESQVRSPVMNPEEIFRLAGWSTPGVDLRLVGRSADRSPLFGDEPTDDRQDAQEFSVEHLQRYERAQSHAMHLAQSHLEDRLLSTDSHATLKGTEAPVGGGKGGQQSLSSRMDVSNAAEADAKHPSREGTTVEAAPTSSAHSSVAVGEGDAQVMVDVPSSFQEIYDISNRNRQRGKDTKDKKRHRDGESEDAGSELPSPVEEQTGSGFGRPSSAVSSATTMTTSNVSGDKKGTRDVDTSAGSTCLPQSQQQERVKQLLQSDAVMDATVFDESIYFSCMDHGADTTMEGTLDFAESLGWLSDAGDRSRVREAHLSDQAKSQAQEAEDIGQGPHGLDGGHGGGGGGAAKPSQRPQSGGSGGRRDSKERSKGHTPPRRSNSGEAKSSFDYSRLSATTGGAMNALAGATVGDESYGQNNKSGPGGVAFDRNTAVGAGYSAGFKSNGGGGGGGSGGGADNRANSNPFLQQPQRGGGRGPGARSAPGGRGRQAAKGNSNSK